MGLLTVVEPGDPTDPGSWARWAMLAPHLLVLGTLADELMLRSVPLVALMRTSAAYLRQRGSVRAACAMMGTAMTLGLRDLDDQQVLGEMHSELGDFYDARGDVHAAREEHAKAIELLVGQLDPGDFRLALARARFGHLLHCEGDEQGAIATLEAVLPALAESADHRYLARAWIDLGYTYWAAGGLQKSASDLDRSAAAFEQAGRILAALPSPARALYAEAASGLGMVRQDQGDLDLASELIELRAVGPDRTARRRRPSGHRPALRQAGLPAAAARRRRWRGTAAHPGPSDPVRDARRHRPAGGDGADQSRRRPTGGR